MRFALTAGLRAATIRSVPKRSSKPRDLNQMAARIVDDATSEAVPPTPHEPPDSEITLYAQALGRRGGRKGGKARAEKLSPEQRSEIALKAARARWSGQKD